MAGSAVPQPCAGNPGRFRPFVGACLSGPSHGDHADCVRPTGQCDTWRSWFLTVSDPISTGLNRCRGGSPVARLFFCCGARIICLRSCRSLPGRVPWRMMMVPANAPNPRPHGTAGGTSVHAHCRSAMPTPKVPCDVSSSDAGGACRGLTQPRGTTRHGVAQEW